MKTFLQFLPEVNILTHDDSIGTNREIASILKYILSQLPAHSSRYCENAFISEDTHIVLSHTELDAISNFLYLNMSIEVYNSIFKNQEQS